MAYNYKHKKYVDLIQGIRNEIVKDQKAKLTEGGEPVSIADDIKELERIYKMLGVLMTDIQEGMD